MNVRGLSYISGASSMAFFTILLAICSAPNLARAQGVDAHGPVPPPVDPDLRSSLTLLAPERSPQGSGSFGVLGEFVDSPLVQVRVVGPGASREFALLDNVAGLNFAGRYVLSKRVGVSLTAPLFLTSATAVATRGLAMGDVHLWVPVGLVLPDSTTGDGLGVSAVPWVQLPTGVVDLFLGDPGVGYGLTTAIGYASGSLSLNTNVGFERSAAERFDNNQRVGGGTFSLGAAVGVQPTESLSVHLESRLSQAFSEDNQLKNPPADLSAAAATPAEMMLTLKGNLPSGVWSAGGLGRGVTAGIGSAGLRVFAGAGWSYTPESSDLPVDGVQGYVIQVVDPDNVPVKDAILLVDDEEVAATGVDGSLTFEDIRWRKIVRVQGPHHVDQVLNQPADDSRNLRVVLDWLPAKVPIRVQNQSGKPVSAIVTATSDEGVQHEVSVVGADSLALGPGNWHLEVASEGQGTQVRDVVIIGAGNPGKEIEVAVLDVAGESGLTLMLNDAEGNKIEGARVLLDGQPIGTTGSGGTLGIAGLAAGSHAIRVLHENFTTYEEPELELSSGDKVVSMVIRRVPGSVKVIARGPGGVIVPDAIVRFDGPRRLAPAPLGARGERIQVLGQGGWQLVVSSAEYGVQQREILVPGDAWELIVVEVVLQPGEQGSADLSLRVVDYDGEPVDGALVTLDGQDFGSTSTGGVLQLDDLRVGARTLQVAGDFFRDNEPIELFLTEGLQERVVALNWQPGTVRVTARQPKGPVPDAVLRWIGEQARAPSPLGPAGDALYQVESGEWTLLATSQSWGLQQAGLLVPEDSRRLHHVDLFMNPDEGGLADLVVSVIAPDGRPVEAAQVSLDGSLMGVTANTGILELKHLSIGTRDLAVSAPLLATSLVTVKLFEGGQDREVELEWAQGTALVQVRSNGAVVTDAVVRMIGPDSVNPSPVDENGEKLFALSPGSWQAVAVSEDFGITQGRIDIPETSDELHQLVLEIAPPVLGMAAVLVRVTDSDGLPVVGAALALDGDGIGSTGPGGALLAEGLAPGTTRIVATHPNHVDMEPLNAKLKVGSQERIVELAWKPGSVHLVVSDEQGRPVDALVTLVGPEDVAPVQIGPDGDAIISLRPGEWQVVGQTSALGPSRVPVTVVASAEPTEIALILSASRVAMTDEAVVIKEAVQFDFGKATLRSDSDTILEEVANVLISQVGIIRAEVQGHSDNVGQVSYNQELSQLRAEAVVRALVERGVSPEKLTARGYGT